MLATGIINLRMKKTTALDITPSPLSSKKAKKYAEYASASGLFMSMAIDMSWKLALSFLTPVILGNFVDNHFKVKGGTYLMIGFILAVILSFIVIYSAYKQSNLISAEVKKRANK